MQYLFLNIASHASTPLSTGDGLAAIVSEDAIVASQPVDHRIGDHELIPLIENLLEGAGIEYEDLDRVACVIGPGGFTSLRMGVTYCNVLADQLQIPSVGVHLSDLFFARITSAAETPASQLRREEEVLWIHSTKKKELFVRSLGSAAGVRLPRPDWSQPTHIALDQFVQDVPKDAEWCGELIEEHRKIVDELELQEAEIAPVEDVLSEFLNTLTYDKEILLPWYGRGW